MCFGRKQKNLLKVKNKIKRESIKFNILLRIVVQLLIIQIPELFGEKKMWSQNNIISFLVEIAFIALLMLDGMAISFKGFYLNEVPAGWCFYLIGTVLVCSPIAYSLIAKCSVKQSLDSLHLTLIYFFKVF